MATKEATPPPMAVKVSVAAKMLGTYPERIRELIEAGELDMVWVGSRKVIVKSIDAFLERHKTNSWEKEEE